MDGILIIQDENIAELSGMPPATREAVLVDFRFSREEIAALTGIALVIEGDKK